MGTLANKYAMHKDKHYFVKGICSCGLMDKIRDLGVNEAKRRMRKIIKGSQDANWAFELNLSQGVNDIGTISKVLSLIPLEYFNDENRAKISIHEGIMDFAKVSDIKLLIEEVKRMRGDSFYSIKKKIRFCEDLISDKIISRMMRDGDYKLGIDYLRMMMDGYIDSNILFLIPMELIAKNFKVLPRIRIYIKQKHAHLISMEEFISKVDYFKKEHGIREPHSIPMNMFKKLILMGRIDIAFEINWKAAINMLLGEGLIGDIMELKSKFKLPINIIKGDKLTRIYEHAMIKIFKGESYIIYL